MSYPPQVHAGPPELSARVVPADVAPDLESPSVAIRYLAGHRRGDAQLGVFRYSMTAARSGPGPHLHRTMSESFVVLSGVVEIFEGRTWRPCTAGDFVHVPPGGVHGFRNASGAPADMLVLFAPAAPREAYFEELAEIARTGRALDDAQWLELWARHDQEPVPTPPA